MHQASKFCTRLFADDTVLTLSNNCERELSNSVDLEIVKIDHWMKINKLSLNYTKIKFMLFRHKLKRMPIPYQHHIAIGEHKLEQVDQIKYLGMIFDEKLPWKAHIKHLCSKISSGSWALLKLRNYVDIQTLKTVYYSLIYSHLQCCISTWGVASAGVLDPLYKLQKRIIRIITKSPYKAHTTSLFKKLNMLKINDICKLEIAKKMFCLNINPNRRLTLNIKGIHETDPYNTRHSSKQNYFLPRKRTKAGKKSISFIGSKIWEKYQFK